MKTPILKTIPVEKLKPAEYNPRKKLKPGDKEYEKIKASIEEFGFADPLVINTDMTIIGGHQRLSVETALGYTEVPCAVVDVDKTREKALNIALNMNIAQMNVRIIFQKSTVITDAIGNHISSWEDYYSCWAEAHTSRKSVSEEEQAGQTREREQIEITVRWCSEAAAISPKGYRIVMGERTYDIIAADEMGYQKRSRKFTCELN